MWTRWRYRKGEEGADFDLQVRDSTKNVQYRICENFYIPHKTGAFFAN